MIVPYDPEWPTLFEAERVRLELALAPWLRGGVHHVGSTAVPGLAAKPIIDMLAAVADLDAARESFAALGQLGYAYRVHRPEAHLLVRDGSHHLHLTEPGSALWQERLAFRDALCRDPELAGEYECWKASHSGAGGYTESKTPFVARVLADRGIELRPDTERLSASVIATRVRDSVERKKGARLPSGP